MDQNEEKKVGIPESITIKGVTYSVKDTPELQAFIQEVAKVEKSKLYTQYENLKHQINNLSKVKVEGSGFDIDTMVEKLRGTFVTKEDFKEILPGVLKEVVQPVLTATEQNRQDELKQYREQLIQANLDTCIPELVKGETKEELDASLQESIRIRTSYPSPSTAHIRTDTKVEDPLIKKQLREYEEDRSHTPTPSTASSPQSSEAAMPGIPRRTSPDASQGGTDIKKMSQAEFERNRESLKRQLEATYGQ